MNVYAMGDMDDDSPAEVEEAPVEEEPAPPPEEETALPEEDVQDVQDEEGPRGIPADDDAIVITGHKKYPTKQELDNDAALFADDVNRGHIKPETIQSLYGKKDTLGKIGTLFGLLVSGAGSGLTGQPNAVLEMMKNEINNDLAAQQNSNANAQNWLRLSQQHELNKAGIGKTNAETEYNKAMTGKIPSEVELSKAHAASARADAELKGLQAAKIRMAISTQKDLKNQLDRMPAGPDKNRAQGIYENTIVPGVNDYISTENQKTAVQLTARSALRGDLPPPTPSAVDMKKLLLLKAAGENNAINGLPNLPGQSMDHETARHALIEAGLVTQNRSAYNVIKNAFEDLDRQAFGGSLNVKNYNVIKAHVVGQLVTSGIPKDEAHDLADSMLPSASDFNKLSGTRQTKATQLWEQFKTKEDNTPNLDPFNLKTPFPGPPQVTKGKASKGSAPKSKAPPAAQVRVWNGKKYRRGPNGESVLVGE